MPWFAWLWCVGMAVCCGGIFYCSWSIDRSVKRIREAKQQPVNALPADGKWHPILAPNGLELGQAMCPRPASDPSASKDAP